MRLVRLTFIATCVASAIVGVACGSTNTVVVAGTAGDSGAGGDASGADDGGGLDTTYPAFVPTSPPQVQTAGGPILQSAKIYPIFFSKDDPTTVGKIADFTTKIGQTNYWKAIVTEYGAGPATSPMAINLLAADDPPTTISDAEIQAFLAAKLNSDDPAFPAPDANSLYAFFYPAGITVTLGGGGPPQDGGADGGNEGGTFDGGGGGGGFSEESCTSFGGYHGDIELDAAHGNLNVAYAVVPRCGNEGPITGLNVTTTAASHEYIEATTDPYPDSTTVNPAYYTVDDDHFYWSSFLGGGEIGDMCAQNTSSFVTFPELPDYEVQRCWSNKAAAAGADPCVPTLANGVYYNSVPIFTDQLALTVGGQAINVPGAHIAVGASETVELDLYSTGATTGPWEVSAIDSQEAAGGTPLLKFAFDKTTGRNGDKIQMTITVLAAGRRSRETFAVASTLNGNINMWVGVVGN